MIEVKSFTDRKGNKVKVGDEVGYFGLEGSKYFGVENGVPKMSGKVERITKAGYFISVYIEGRRTSWCKPWIEKIFPKDIDSTETTQAKPGAG